jgi:hypothetical protein
VGRAAVWLVLSKVGMQSRGERRGMGSGLPTRPFFTADGCGCNSPHSAFSALYGNILIRYMEIAGIGPCGAPKTMLE